MALTLNNLQFSNTEATPIVSIETITLKDCEWLSIIGGNGSGKSTLASCIAGWVPALLPGQLQGSIILNHQEIIGLTALELSASVQYVQQAPQWQLSGCAFTVEEELTFGAENLAFEDSIILQQLEHILHRMDLTHLRQRNPTTLSGGEMQRLMIGSALMMNPQLLILDEAFSRMTHENHLKMLHCLQEISQQSSMHVILLEKKDHITQDFCQHSQTLPKRVHL